MTTTMSDVDRAAFEAWFSAEYPALATAASATTTEGGCGESGGRTYATLAKGNIARAWQAALAYARSEGAPPPCTEERPCIACFTDNGPCERPDNILYAAACECLSPEQMDKFEMLFADVGTARRFQNCVAKRIAAFRPTAEQEAPETPPDRDDLTEPEALASKLIDVWIAEKGRKIPWATAIKICAAVTKQPDDERDALLALATEDEAPHAKDLTDDALDSLWLHRVNIHNGELMPQLRDYARAVIAALQPTAEPGKEGE